MMSPMVAILIVLLGLALLVGVIGGFKEALDRHRENR